MKRLVTTAALALLAISVSAPAMANMEYRTVREGYTCRVEADGERHCWNHRHRWYHDVDYIGQQGQDVNSNTWADGSPRATLPPHNSRGTSRPDTGSDFDYWLNF